MSTYNCSSVVGADFAPGALGTVDYDDSSITGSLQLLHVGIATSVWDISRAVRLEDNTLHRMLEEGLDLKGGREGGVEERGRERER